MMREWSESIDFLGRRLDLRCSEGLWIATDRAHPGKRGQGLSVVAAWDRLDEAIGDQAAAWWAARCDGPRPHRPAPKEVGA